MCLRVFEIALISDVMWRMGEKRCCLESEKRTCVWVCLCLCVCMCVCVFSCCAKSGLKN